MNPFDWYGPQFLIFYCVFAAAVIALFHFVRRWREAELNPPSLGAREPYVVACLRDGPEEVVRIATMTLVDRGLIQVTNSSGLINPGAKVEDGETRVERAVLKHFAVSRPITAAVREWSIITIAKEDYEMKLRDERLIPDLAMKTFRMGLLLVALLALGGVAIAKLLIAFDRDRTNVGFLIVTMIVAMFVVLFIANPYRSTRGDNYLAGMRALFWHLRNRAASVQPGGASRDLLWLTAVFGTAALPAAAHPLAEYLWPKRYDSVSGCGAGAGGCGGSGGGGGCGGCGG